MTCVVCDCASSSVDGRLSIDPPRVFIGLPSTDRAERSVCSVCIDVLAESLAVARELALDMRADGSPLFGTYSAVEAEIALAEQAEQRALSRRDPAESAP